jgi:hypothetical protein
MGDYTYLITRKGGKVDLGSNFPVDDSDEEVEGNGKKKKEKDPYAKGRLSIESFHDAIRMKGGDCVAEYEEIYTEDGKKCMKRH